MISTPASPPQKTLPLDYLYGIRGVLMMMVLLAHVRTCLTYQPNGKIDSPWYQISSVWIQPAVYAVAFFVVISGYCLMIPVARTDDGVLKDGFWGYMGRRARRILPPYYAAIAVSLVLILWLPEGYIFIPNRYESVSDGLRSGPIVSHLFLGHIWVDQWRYKINPVLWAVGVEWQLYILLPLVFIPFWRRFGTLTLVIAANLFWPVVLKLNFWFDKIHIWYVGLFALGMAASVIQYSKKPRETAWRENVRWGAISGALFGLFGVGWIYHLVFEHDRIMLPQLPPSPWYCINEMILGVATFALILYCGNKQHRLPEAQWPAVLRFLSHRWVTFTGMFSYSHYLIHFPVLIAIHRQAQFWGLSVPGMIAYLYLVAMPLSICAGYLFFRLVEGRFLPTHLSENRVAALRTA